MLDATIIDSDGGEGVVVLGEADWRRIRAALSLDEEIVEQRASLAAFGNFHDTFLAAADATRGTRGGANILDVARQLIPILHALAEAGRIAEPLRPAAVFSPSAAELLDLLDRATDGAVAVARRIPEAVERARAAEHAERRRQAALLRDHPSTREIDAELEGSLDDIEGWV